MRSEAVRQDMQLLEPELSFKEILFTCLNQVDFLLFSSACAYQRSRPIGPRG